MIRGSRAPTYAWVQGFYFGFPSTRFLFPAALQLHDTLQARELEGSLYCVGNGGARASG